MAPALTVCTVVLVPQGTRFMTKRRLPFENCSVRMAHAVDAVTTRRTRFTTRVCFAWWTRATRKGTPFLLL
jgi:hypothetical protein